MTQSDLMLNCSKAGFHKHSGLNHARFFQKSRGQKSTNISLLSEKPTTSEKLSVCVCSQINLWQKQIPMKDKKNLFLNNEGNIKGGLALL